MFKDLRTKQGQNELAESIAQSFTMKEVPLIVANASDQQAFVPWMADLCSGTNHFIAGTFSNVPVS